MAKSKVNEEIKTETPIVENTPIVSEPVPVSAQPKEETVTITSADNRRLEASINGVFWNDRSIEVPKPQEGEVRRLLEVGGFYVKN